MRFKASYWPCAELRAWNILEAEFFLQLSNFTLEFIFAIYKLLCFLGPDVSHQSFWNGPALLQLRAV